MQAARKRTTTARRTSKPSRKLQVVRPRSDDARTRSNLEYDRIKDPALAAKVKQATDVARATAVLLNFCAEHATADQCESFAFNVGIPLFPAADLLDERERDQLFHCQLFNIIEAADQLLTAAHEGIATAEIPSLFRSMAGTLRQAADETELRYVGSAGTLATQAIYPGFLPVRLEQELARIRGAAQNR